jgi:hypothetical protein
MKKNIFLVCTLLSVTTAFTGCSSDNDVNEITDGRKMLSISDVSRAGETGFTSDFGMFILSGDGLYGNDENNRNNKVSFSENKWNTEVPVWLKQQEGNMYCYYPYSSAVTNPKALAMDLTSGTDYLYSEGKVVSYALNTLTVDFKHALVKVNINVDKTPESITVKSTATAKTFDLTTKNFSAATTTGDLSVSGNTIYLFPGLAPTLKIKIEGTEYEYIPNQTFTGGSEYTYNLTVTERHLMEIGEVKVSNWNTGGSYNDAIY